MTTESSHAQVRQARLGRTGMMVSRIAFGTWQLGGDWGATDEDAAIRAIRHDSALARRALTQMARSGAEP